jgi:butyryl-CoA dehydrogenase
MDYFLSEEQGMIVDIARQITDELIIPNRAELDEKDEFPRKILESMGQADLFGVPIPEEYGGFGGGCLDIVLALEQLGRGCIGVATAFAASALGIYPIMIAGSEEMKQKYLPPVAAGKACHRLPPGRHLPHLVSLRPMPGLMHPGSRPQQYSMVMNGF